MTQGEFGSTYQPGGRFSSDQLPGSSGFSVAEAREVASLIVGSSAAACATIGQIASRKMPGMPKARPPRPGEGEEEDREAPIEAERPGEHFPDRAWAIQVEIGPVAHEWRNIFTRSR